ncbi:uncharacterized protein LOC106714454 [Papilio machaon]|uniref:uncharacterized protein LOC106714454 n=1 Tax=Papilio machaon TaxID=76193 RepID=UPI001E664F18|nr:uncharacterized protein LOC106714454 [Papilio machaon]
MDRYTLLLLSCTVISTAAWSRPFYPVHRLRAPVRVTRFAPPPYPVHHAHHHNAPAPVREEEPQAHRPKRGYYDHDHDLDQDRRETSGITGSVHTFVKTDKNANYKWGVRHHVGNKYAS